MKTFMMASDEAHQAIAQIGAQAIADGERARLAMGHRLAEEQRKLAEVRAQLFRDMQTSAASVAEVGRRMIADMTGETEYHG